MTLQAGPGHSTLLCRSNADKGGLAWLANLLVALQLVCANSQHSRTQSPVSKHREQLTQHACPCSPIFRPLYPTFDRGQLGYPVLGQEVEQIQPRQLVHAG